jgi:hypothetical protein
MWDNPRRLSGARLHTVDDFIWRELFEARAPDVDIGVGNSFQGVCEANLSELAELVKVHRRRLPDDRLGSARAPKSEGTEAVPVFSTEDITNPLGLVFVDAAKSWSGLVHLTREIAPLCIPGETVLVWQDFKFAANWWVSLGVSALLEADPASLELLHVVRNNSVAFRVRGPLAVDALPASVDDVDAGHGVELIDGAARMLDHAGDASGARIVRLSTVAFLADIGEPQEAVDRFRALEEDWPLGLDPRPLEDIRTLLWHAGGRDVSPHRAARRARLYHRAARIVRVGTSRFRTR